MPCRSPYIQRRHSRGPQSKHRTAGDGERRWLALLWTTSVGVDAHSAPTHIFNDLNKVHRFTQVEGLHASIHLVILELG